MQRAAADDPLTPAPGERDGADRQSRVAHLAHELFVARGMGPGHDMEDWLEAERQVDAQRGVDERVTWRR
jgi:hypothetical protein